MDWPDAIISDNCLFPACWLKRCHHTHIICLNSNTILTSQLDHFLLFVFFLVEHTTNVHTTVFEFQQDTCIEIYIILQCIILVSKVNNDGIPTTYSECQFQLLLERLFWYYVFTVKQMTKICIMCHMITVQHAKTKVALRMKIIFILYL